MLVNQTTLQSFLQETYQQILDTLFPLRCLGCQKKNAWICPLCQHRFLVRIEQLCPECLQHITPSGEVCFSCKDNSPTALDGIFVASYYKQPLLSHALHTYKYRFIPDLSIPLGLLLTNALEKSALPLPDAIIPVPLHKRRLHFRGFNQSELLAKELTKNITPGLEIPLLSDVLSRIRYTKPQMKTESRAERRVNLKNAFALTENKESIIKGKYLWLIDDVATTGTTLDECAKIFKKHGATSVFGVVLAR